MNNRENRKEKRQVKTGEKLLLGVSLLAIILLVTIGVIRSNQPQYDERMATPEMTSKSIVKAMLSQNQAQIKSLSTPRGYAALQKVMTGTAFNSSPKLGNRIFAEWGNSIYWENFNDSTARGGWGLSKTVKTDEATPKLTFKRTGQGWRLDNYVPQPNRLLKRRMSAGKAWNLKE